jgi:ribosomal protein S27AE
MIKKFIEIRIECDRCHYTYIFKNYNDENMIIDNFKSDGWLFEDDKCICPECKRDYLKEKELNNNDQRN